MEEPAPAFPDGVGADTPGPAAGVSADPVALAGTRWRFEDETGARFVLAFEADGRIGEVADARFWQWRRDGEALRIAYDNGWGARVVRTGRVEGGRMAGTARGTRGSQWRWQAERLAARPETRPAAAR